jgi:alpha-tubulin suppressor-like RCC1 family protein
MDSNEIYDEVWAKEYTKLFNMNISNKSPLQIIKTGSCHTMTINSKGRVFSWGWNNYGQCGQPMYTSYKNNFALPEVYRDKKGNIQNIPNINYLHSGRSLNIDGLGPVKSVTCGEDHSFLIDENGNVFAFGNNGKGQLGLGNIWEIEKPQLITSLKGKVKEIHSSGDLNLAVTNDNELYIWPFENYKKNYIPMRMYLDHKITIQTISCGKNFAVILSKQGVLYSFGKSNKYGELGLGDNKQRLSPETIYSLADSGEKIVQVSCGFKHTIAKGSTGKVFTWGNVIFLLFRIVMDNWELEILKIQLIQSLLILKICTLIE